MSDADGDGRTHVLFVDDEPEVLEALADALRAQREHWRMSFAAGPQRAMEALESDDGADVVVTDMRMAGMDGAELLTEVQRRWPDTVRIVLSGYADPSLVARAAPVAHRFLAKPAQTDDLVRVVRRSCALHDLSAEVLRTHASLASASLPSAPVVYQELTRLLHDPDSSAADVARVVERDVAISAKVLQLANSAFFGTGRTIGALQEAVARLGVTILRALTLQVGAFETLRPGGHVEGLSIGSLTTHSNLVARIARRIAPDGAGDDAFTAGLLHDVGLLVRARHAPTELAAQIATARRRGVPLHAIERAGGASSHAALGAHLLDLWGIPHTIAEAVAYHHAPGEAPGHMFDHVTAVHVADRLAREVSTEHGPRWPCGELDDEYLGAIGVLGRLDQWRELAFEEALRASGGGD